MPLQVKPLFLACIATAGSWLSGNAQTVIPLYNDSIPNSRPVEDAETAVTDQQGHTRISNVSRPTLTVYLPSKEKATGAAIVICPGGGYRFLSMTKEGAEVARQFTEMGVAAFVLKYRLPDDATMINKSTGPIMDAQRAIQLVRERAKEFGIDKNRVGIIGFSAGGHLASTAGTHFNQHYIPAKKKNSLRPDFMILIYPVISFADSICHLGSRNNLIGENPSEESKRAFSNELRVTRKTPPTYLVHAEDDKVVKVQNMLLFAAALQEHKVPFDFYLYEKGGHGFGLHNNTSDVRWIDQVQLWLDRNGWLDKK